MIHTFYVYIALLSCIIGGNNPFLREKWENIKYANVSSEETLNIYLPKNETGGKLAALVILGDGTWRDSILNNALKRGYAAVTVNYRSIKTTPFPAAIQDVNAAIKWLKGFGRKYNISPDKLILCGAGEGGYLAALAAVSESYQDGVMAQIEFGSQPTNIEAQNSEQQNQYWIDLFNIFPGSNRQAGRELSRQHPKVAGVIDFYGYTKNIGKLQISNSELNRAKATVQTSVANYVTPVTPPFLLICGENDRIVPLAETKALYNTLRENLCPPGTGKCPVQLIVIPDSWHGGDKFESPEITMQVFDFIHSIMN